LTGYGEGNEETKLVSGTPRAITVEFVTKSEKKEESCRQKVSRLSGRIYPRPRIWRAELKTNQSGRVPGAKMIVRVVLGARNG